MTTTLSPFVDSFELNTSDRGRHLTVASLFLAGILFVIYPAARPFSDEKGLQGAAAFASNRWVAAHGAAIVAFIFLLLGIYGVCEWLRTTPAWRRSVIAFVLAVTGIGLTLPYYGAEVFGLHALGRETLNRQDGTLTDVAHSIRFGPGVIFIVTGLILLGAATVVLASAVARSGRMPRWSGALLALGSVLFLPQFAASQPVRIAHGVLLLAGCVALAVPLLFRPARTPRVNVR